MSGTRAPERPRDINARLGVLDERNTFLNFGGNCEQAFRFYAQHLGGAITMLMRRAEQPDQPVTWPGWEQSIQYAIMKIGETELMGSDVPPERFQPTRLEAADSVTVSSTACEELIGGIQ